MDVSQFVPGHGTVVDKDYVRTSLAYFTELHNSLSELKKKDVPEEEIHIHESLPKFYESKVPDFMKRILSFWYQEIEV